jgi:hypothetical protein
LRGPATDFDDITVIKRRARSTIVSLSGRYALASRRDARGERREFACRTIGISIDEITLVGPVTGPIGERVVATFDELGKLEGRIVGLIDNGFVICPALSDSRSVWLAAKIDWLDKHRHHNLPDDRTHKRIIPQRQHSTVLLADGRVLACFVIDMSVSGAAVSADLTPRRGDVLAVGKIIGRVVRLFSEGFAVRFIELQDAKLLEERLIQS